MLDNIRPTEQQELDALLFEASDLVKSVRHNPQPTSVEEQLRILEDLAKSLPSGTITLDPRKVGRMEKPPQVEPSTPPEVSTSETKKSRFSDEERQLLEELASDPEDFFSMIKKIPMNLFFNCVLNEKTLCILPEHEDTHPSAMFSYHNGEMWYHCYGCDSFGTSGEFR